jgi:hypothetical protein
VSEKPTLRSFQDIRDVAAETIRQVRDRDVTSDQVKGIQGLLTLAAETIVKEEAINRAFLANNNPAPATTSSHAPAKGSKSPETPFILTLNVNTPESSRIIDVQAHTPTYVIDEDPYPDPALEAESEPLDLRVLAGQQMTAARAAAVDVKENNRGALLARLRAQGGRP